ncbi:MAG TPA: DUF1592 domain-containing protein [Polyangiaceae bacterium]|nr:DUF1592 domain-containing protein [Polyangiaceae bacterium]
MNNTGTKGLVLASFLVAGCSGGGIEATGSNGAGAGPGVDGPASGNTAGMTTTTTTGSGGATTGATGTTSSVDGGEVVNPDVCVPGIAATSQIPRMTNTQYDNTIRDLLGVTALSASSNVAPSTLLATDQAGGLTDLGWSAYKSVADMIATQVMEDPTLKANYLKCTPTGADTCLHDTIVEFGRRAFRRPLTEAEVARFDAVVADGAAITPTGAPEEVARAVLYMFLVSPSFIQRAETNATTDGAGGFVLSSHEVATRLSYMLWGSTPDDTLNQAADQGLLATPEQILTQAERMLQDPKARDMVNAFHRRYLLMGPGGRWDTAQKDPALFPAFKPEQVPFMAEETLRFFDHVAFSPGGTFQDFLLSPVAFVNNQTAPLYGLNAADYGTEMEQVTLDPNQRPGFLTRAAFLNGYSSYNRTSPILRGAFITKEIIGIHIDAPPPGADQTELPNAAELLTNRERVDAQTSPPACASCHHSYINPPGFVMEAFDSVGAWQTTELSTGAPIDTSAEITIVDGQDPVLVNGPYELMQAIASSPTAMRQYAKRWVSYAYEREGDPKDACVVDDLALKMTAGGYSVLNLITDLTQTDSFRTRVVEAP